MTKKKKKKYKFSFDESLLDRFSISIAEHEDFLKDTYCLNKFYKKAEDIKNRKSFFIGRTGVGKTAILKYIEEKYQYDNNALVIPINPEDFAFRIIEGNTVIRTFSECGINFTFFYKSLWLLIIATQLIKKKYGDKKEGRLKQLFKGHIERRAYKLLEGYGGLESDIDYQEEIAKILKRVEHDIDAEVKLGVVKLKYKGKLPPEEKGKVQKVVESYEFLKIKEFLTSFDKELGKYEKAYILIDDLDKSWVPKSIRADFTGSLIETLSYFSDFQNMKVIVSLRTNLFEQIKLHQTEKYEPFIQNVYWEKDELLGILNKRLEKILQINTNRLWKESVALKVHTDNKKTMPPLDYIYKRSNNRPRDLILFFSDILHVSLKKGRITQEHIFQAEKKYSTGRLKALVEEWHSPYEGLDILLNYFNSVSYRMKYDDFSLILNQIMDKFIELSGQGPLSETKYSWIEEGDFIDLLDFSIEPLFHFFYKIGFIGVKVAPSSPLTYSWLDFGQGIPKITHSSMFYINPCYHSALNIRFDRS